jgi:hypothetical protein
MIDRQQAVIDRQQAQLDAHAHQQDALRSRLLDVDKRVDNLQVSTAIQNHRNGVTRSGRALSMATCAETSGPRFFVQGVCACADDVIIGEQSVKDELGRVNATLANLNTNVVDGANSLTALTARVDVG